MPILVRYLNDPNQNCVLRPAPIVSVSPSPNRTKDGTNSSTYQITLKGHILADLGFPLARDTRNNGLFDYHDSVGAGPYVPATANAGPYLSFDTRQSHSYSVDIVTGAVTDNRPDRQYVPYESAVDAILFKQKVIRALFSKDGQRLEISAIHTDEPSIICYPRFVSCDFTDGIYVDRCEYTITLETDVLYDKDLKVDLDGNPLYLEGMVVASGGMTDSEIMEASGRFIDTYSDNWSLEAEDGLGESANLTKSYRISRSISATGKDYWAPTSLDRNGTEGVEKRHAWEQARDYVQFRLQDEPLTSGYPNVMGRFGSGLLDLVEAYEGFDHKRTESISITDGTYSVTEDWVLASGKAYENYNMSVSTSIDDPFVNVSIQGEIRGLGCVTPSGSLYGGMDDRAAQTPYQSALSKYYDVSSSGRFGVGSDIFKRANNSVAVELNAQPQSIALATNEFDGSITYSLDFNNRPTNIISGVLTETINISDTYPGDIFAVIPVIGRATGPVLQAIGGRSEYTRDLSIDLIMDYTDIPYGSGRNSLLLKKPSVLEPTKSQLNQLVKELSPEFEPGVRKWFVSPMTESWTPKEGRYSFSISWTYELSK